MRQRVDHAQRMLDARQFRTMRRLDLRDHDRPETSGVADTTTTSDAVDAAVYAEVAADAIRIIDSTRSLVLWRHSFAFATSEPRDDQMCFAPYHSQFEGVWWDVSTRTLLVHQGYKTGGCMCSSGIVEHVRRIPYETAQSSK